MLQPDDNITDIWKDWLKKATNDLRAARKLVTGDDAVPDIAIFHTQQCAEKALKGYLALKKQPIQKTHDLDFLLKQCSQFNKDLEKLFECTELLQPYCFKFRYPDDKFNPEVSEVKQAICCAEKILNFIKKVIQEQQNPTTSIFE